MYTREVLVSLRERFRLEEIESEALKQNRNFPIKEKIETEEVVIKDASAVDATKGANQENLKDLGL